MLPGASSNRSPCLTTTNSHIFVKWTARPPGILRGGFLRSSSDFSSTPSTSHISKRLGPGAPGASWCVLMVQRGRPGVIAQAFLLVLVLSQASAFVHTVSRSIHDSVSHTQPANLIPVAPQKIEDNLLGQPSHSGLQPRSSGRSLTSPVRLIAQSRVASDGQDVRTATTWPLKEGLRPRLRKGGREQLAAFTCLIRLLRRGRFLVI